MRRPILRLAFGTAAIAVVLLGGLAVYARQQERSLWTLVHVGGNSNCCHCTYRIER